MISDEFPYLLFLKMYRSELQNYATTYIEQLQDFSMEEKKTLHIISVSFIQFLASQMKHQKVNLEALQYWVQIHQHGLPANKTSYFPNAIEYVIHKVLNDINHPNKEQILLTHEKVMKKSMKGFLYFTENYSIPIELSKQSLSQLDAFSKVLIQLNGTEDLPILLTKAEEIFRFKRSIFFSYNPWLNEFSGVIGYELPKIQRMQGKIEIEPVFAMKKPIFLREPSPYIQPIAIDLFGLSSIIFIPIEFEQQLFGWVSFDQVGEKFDCTQEQLLLLEEAGKRLGMYLNRKQLRNTMNYRLQMSEKEFAILYLLAEGYSNKQMAEMLYISEFTVRDYVQKLMVKLHAKNRTQIISTAFRMGLVE